MSKRYHATNLDHLAEFMLYLSTASSFWLSLHLAYGHSISLSDILVAVVVEVRAVVRAVAVAVGRAVAGAVRRGQGQFLTIN
jgi:hypothetical protein